LLTLATLSLGMAPDRRGEVAPDRTFDLKRLSLDLTLHPDEEAVSGVVTLTVQRLSPGPLVLDQVALEIEAVASGGAPVSWWTEGDLLILPLADDARDVEIRYRARPRTGMHFRHATPKGPDAWDEVWTQGEDIDHRHWLPSWDHPGDRFIYEGRVTAPEGWTAFTNSGHDMVNYLIMVVAGRHELHTHPADPRVTVAAPPGTSPQAISHVLDPVPEMMAWMGARTGVPYPWGDYRQVFVQRFLYTAMENTGATVAANKLLVDDRVIATRSRIDRVVAHELAHQWYGDWLTCRSWRELWLNEGFATFIAADWQAREDPWVWADRVRHWFDHSSSGPALAGRFHQGDDQPANHNVYMKGASALQMLRTLLGEETFWAGIRAYTQRPAPALVETHELRRALEDVSGRDLSWFFQQWVELPHVPELTVTDRFRDGELQVTIRQSTARRTTAHEDEPLYYTLPVTVAVGTAEGERRVFGWLDDATRQLTVPLEAPPRYIAFDPDGGILAKIEQTQDPARWAAQLRDADAPLARIAAARALAETGASETLQTILLDDTQPQTLRREAAKALGRQRATTPLLAAADSVTAEPVRGVVAAALGRCPEPAAANALAEMARRESNPDVRGAALQALARLNPEHALRLARSRTVPPDREHHHLASVALGVLGEHGAPSDLGRILSGPRVERMPHPALRAAVRLVGRQDDGTRAELAPRVARAAEELLTDRDLRGRELAVWALEAVGDRQNLPALERLRREETARGLSQKAGKAAAAIRSRAAPPAAPAAADARIEELESRIEALEKEVERWEERR